MDLEEYKLFCFKQVLRGKVFQLLIHPLLSKMCDFWLWNMSAQISSLFPSLCFLILFLLSEGRSKNYAPSLRDRSATCWFLKRWYKAVLAVY